MIGHGEGKGPVFAGEVTVSDGFRNSNSLRGHLRAEEIADGTVEIDMNHLENSSLGSPPTGSRSLDEYSSDQGSDQVRILNSRA